MLPVNLIVLEASSWAATTYSVETPCRPLYRKRLRPLRHLRSLATHGSLFPLRTNCPYDDGQFH